MKILLLVELIYITILKQDTGSLAKSTLMQLCKQNTDDGMCKNAGFTYCC